VPVIVLIDGLPIPKILRGMNAARRSMQYQVKFLCHGANALQRAPEQGRKVRAKPRLVQSSTLERSFMVAWHDPSFIRHARRIGTESNVVSPSLDYTLGLVLFLLDDVAEYAALLTDEVLATGTKFIEHAPRDKHGRGDL